MPIDVAIANPAFLDLTFVGLEGLPEVGEERFAAELVRSPGGGAIIAVAAARLGLSAALAAPLGDDHAGRFVADALEREGVRLVERRARRTPETVVLPIGADRAMVTADPGVRAVAGEVAALAPRAVVVSLDQLYCVPDGAAAYVTCGEDDARAYARRPPAELAATRALFVNHREALALTGAASTQEALEELAKTVPTVVVTLGAAGAVAMVDGSPVHVPGLEVPAVRDTTGAGDLLTAAYVWADMRGASPTDRVRWAVVYSGLSVTAPTGVGGAVDEARLLAEGTRLGLPAPGSADGSRRS